MIPGEIQDFHGQHGEDTTAQLLGRRFWYLRRSVDIEGADFLVQLRSSSLDALESRRPEIFVLGIVQSKFFRPGTTVYIKKSYCVDLDDAPIEHFFLMCHTQDDQELTHTYFFTAEQVMRLPYNAENDAYRFYIGRDDPYADRKDLPPSQILDTIQNGILKSKEEKNIRYIQRLFLHTRAVGRSNGYRCCYLLRHLEGVDVCIAEADGTGNSSVLEPRRDLFPNFGGFAWGYAGTGPQFLAWSLLTHLKDGAPPSLGEVTLVVHRILEILPDHLEWDVPPELIEALLGGLMLSAEETQALCRRSATKGERISVLHREAVRKKLRQHCATYGFDLMHPDWLNEGNAVRGK